MTVEWNSCSRHPPCCKCNNTFNRDLTIRACRHFLLLGIHFSIVPSRSSPRTTELKCGALSAIQAITDNHSVILCWLSDFSNADSATVCGLRSPFCFTVALGYSRIQWTRVHFSSPAVIKRTRTQESGRRHGLGSPSQFRVRQPAWPEGRHHRGYGHVKPAAGCCRPWCCWPVPARSAALNCMGSAVLLCRYAAAGGLSIYPPMYRSIYLYFYLPTYLSVYTYALRILKFTGWEGWACTLPHGPAQQP